MSGNNKLLRRAAEAVARESITEIKSSWDEVKKEILSGKADANAVRSAYIILDDTYSSGIILDGVNEVVNEVVGFLRGNKETNLQFFRSCVIFIKDLLFVSQNIETVLRGYSMLYKVLNSEEMDDNLKGLAASALVDLYASWIVNDVPVSEQVRKHFEEEQELFNTNYRLMAFAGDVYKQFKNLMKHNKERKHSDLHYSGDIIQLATFLATLDFFVFTRDFYTYIAGFSEKVGSAVSRKVSYFDALVRRLNYYKEVHENRAGSLEVFKRDYSLALREGKGTEFFEEVSNAPEKAFVYRDIRNEQFRSSRAGVVNPSSYPDNLPKEKFTLNKEKEAKKKKS